MLALSINAVLGPWIGNVMIAVGVVSVPTFARLTHGQVLSVREREYVLAARVTSVGAWRMISPAAGAAIFLAVLAFNLLGDGLRQALDPRLKERGLA